MTALTLADYLNTPKPLVAGVVKALMDESDFLRVLPIENVAALAVKVIREGGLPSISWRQIGAAHGSNKATKPTEVEEVAFSFGNYIDVDIAYTKDKSPRLYDPRTYQLDQTVKAMAREFDDAIINGIPTATPNRPTGLFYRLTEDLSSNQSILAASGGLDISPNATGLSTNIQTFIDQLDNLHYACADHKADAFLMNSTMLTRWWSLARQSGLLKVTADNLGREFYEYKGAKFIDMGFKVDDSTNIIGNVELATGDALSGGACTSIYGVKFGKEYFTGWQEYPLDVKEKGELEDGVTERTIVDWIVGIALSHPRSVARLYGIIAA